MKKLVIIPDALYDRILSNSRRSHLSVNSEILEMLYSFIDQRSSFVARRYLSPYSDDDFSKDMQECLDEFKEKK